MLRFPLRLIGFVLLAAAFAALIVDGTRSLAARRLMAFSVEETARWLVPGRLADVVSAADRGPALIEAGLRQALSVPTCVATGLLAVLLLFAGRAKPDSIGLEDGP